MPRPKIRIVAASLAAFASMAGAQAQSPYGIGRIATPAEIAGWNIDIGRDGSGLPPGSGTVSHGREVFEQQWPTLFDYIRRAMPQNAPQSLSNEDVYAVSAYILNLNGLLPADATLDAEMLAAIKMPNRNMFVGDPRPDVKNPACTSGC